MCAVPPLTDVSGQEDYALISADGVKHPRYYLKTEAGHTYVAEPPRYKRRILREKV